jgi:hypothetical protein
MTEFFPFLINGFLVVLKLQGLVSCEPTLHSVLGDLLHNVCVTRKGHSGRILILSAEFPEELTHSASAFWTFLKDLVKITTYEKFWHCSISLGKSFNIAMALLRVVRKP